MATLAPPILPQYLFRYRPLVGESDKLVPDSVFNREIAAITQPYMFCANFDKLNDPMEGYYQPTRRVQRHARYDEIVKSIADGKSNVGIASLSDTNKSELMWTHYAVQSTGICIEYRARILLGALPDDAILVRVGYDEKPADFGIGDIVKKDEAVKKILSQKKVNWSYEREWRVLGTLGKNRIKKTSINCIRNIYMGSRITEHYRFKLHMALVGTSIKLYDMAVNGYTYVEKPYVPPKAF